MRIKQSCIIVFIAALLCTLQAHATNPAEDLRFGIDSTVVALLPSVKSIELSLPGYVAFANANGAGEGIPGDAFFAQFDHGLSAADPRDVDTFGTGDVLTFAGSVTKSPNETSLGDLVPGLGFYDNGSDFYSYTVETTGDLTDPLGNTFLLTVMDQFSIWTEFGAKIDNDWEAFGIANGWNITLKDADGNALAGTFVYYADDPLGNLDVSFMIVGAAPVPVPAAMWLMGSALLCLSGLRRRRSVASIVMRKRRS